MSVPMTIAYIKAKQTTLSSPWPIALPGANQQKLQENLACIATYLSQARASETIASVAHL